MRSKMKNWLFSHSRFSLGSKLTLMLLLITHIAFSSEKAFSQQNITVQFKKQSLSEVLNVLKTKTTYEFLYNDEEVKNITDITRDFTDATISEILKSCLAGTKYNFKIVNNIIIITPDDQKKEEVKAITVKGKVYDEKGESLPGVAITLKKTTLGVVSDIDGKFEIKLPKRDTMILVFSFLGMKSQEVDVNKIKDLTKDVIIKLQPDVTEVDEVVVTGYGQIKKQSFTGSAQTIEGKELMKASKSNVIKALQAFDPSFRIQTNNQWGSDPNALPEMYIRGRSGIGVKELNKDPLSKSALQNNPNLPTFILDGFEVDVQKVYDLDMNRVANITILKDAAATAMYGSRAANGVIVIELVAPKPGEVTVSYTGKATVTMPDLSDYNLANAREKLDIEVLSGLYDPANYNGLDDAIKAYNKRYERIVEGVDTDWMSMPLRNVVEHQHSLYVEGGNNDLRYGLDAQFNNRGGVMKDSYRRTMGVGFSVDYRLNKKFQVKNTISYTYTKSQESPYGSFSDYTELLPYDRPYNKEGKLVEKLDFSVDASNSGLNNPLYEATLNNFEYSKYDEFIDNLSMNWYVDDFLSVKGQFSITKQYTKGERFYDPLSSKVSAKDSDDSDGLLGDLYWNKGENTNWNANVFVYYNRLIGVHSINFSLGMNARSTKTTTTSIHYRGFPSGELHSPNYAAEVYDKPSKSENQTRLVGFIGSLNYTYNDIYLLDASVRFDGSSEFGRNQPWGSFWSGGLGLNIHNYEFMKDNGIFDQLKIRGSYGQTGKVNFSPYSAITTYEAQTDEWYKTGYGVKLKALGNADLTWETTNELNIGLDMTVFNRFTLNFDFYNKKTVDLINDVTLPTSSGFSYYVDNVGENQNRGFEIQLRADIIKKRDLNIALWGNLAHNKNKILKISESLKMYNDQVNDYYKEAEDDQVSASWISKDPKYSKPIMKYEEGGSLTSLFAMQSLGIDPSNGKELFLNRDGSVTHTWSATQQVIVGNTEPDAQGSFGLNAIYKNFTLFVNFMYQWGGQAYNQTLVDRVENAKVENRNVDKRVLTDRWQNPGDVTPLKDIKNRDVTTLPTSRFVQDDNFLTLSSISLTYDFNESFVKRLRMSRMSFEVSMEDIVRWSSIRQERGLSYPFARGVSFSLMVNF